MIRTARPRSNRSRIARCVAAALLLAGSVAVQAQQGFDQAPTYPNPATGQPGYQTPPNQSGYPPAMPNNGQPGYPSGPNVPPPMPPGYPNPNQPNSNPTMPTTPGGPTGQGNPVQAMVQMELQDYGVPAQPQLQATMHGPTPTSIPGGQVITTDRLLGMYQQGQQGGGLLVFHVLGPGPTLPMAQNAVGAAQAGSFQDQTQQQFGQYLQQVTQGNKAVPMVFYCQSTQCWMSYNAALRAINMGYTQVYWYRGGIEAWQRVEQMAMGMPQQGGQQPPPQQGGYQNAGYPQQQPPNRGGW